MDAKRIDRVLQLNMGIFSLKFSMNFLMNICNHLQVIAALLIGGWMVHTDQLELGGVVAFISAVGRLNDPWRSWSTILGIERVAGEISAVADRVNQLGDRGATLSIDRESEQPLSANVYS